jgi:hypothetical protein
MTKRSLQDEVAEDDVPGDADTPDEEPVPEPEPVDVGNWQPTIVEPAPVLSPEDEAAANAPTRPVLPEGDTVVVYHGAADLVGPVDLDGVSYSFRPDVPVTVPSKVAEEVLTWPNETFEVVTED